MSLDAPSVSGKRLRESVIATKLRSVIGHGVGALASGR